MLISPVKDSRFKPEFQFSLATKYRSYLYRREIQLLINIQQPDPEFQPLKITDNIMIFDVVTANENLIRIRFENYFEQPFNFNLKQPLWKLVEDIRLRMPDWPG